MRSPPAYDPWQGRPTAYLKDGGTPETTAQMANHTGMRTTRLYDRRREELNLDVVEGSGRRLGGVLTVFDPIPDSRPASGSPGS